MRLFVAMDIPEAVRRALAELAGGLRSTCREARWTRLESSHLTLKFIGEVLPAQAQNIQEALGNVRVSSSAGAPIEVRFAGLGFFPDARCPRVFWSGVEGGAALGELAAAIEEALEPLGIARESRDFHPHITLARFSAPREQDVSRLRAAVASLGSSDFGSARVDQFCLYQSILKSAGAEYTRLATYRFS